MSDLFVEVFPIEPDAIPPLTGYVPRIAPDAPPDERGRIGGRLAARLRRLFDGDWLWIAPYIVTDNAALTREAVAEVADALRAEKPEAFAALDGLHDDTTDDLPAGIVAVFIQRTALRPHAEAMAATLDAAGDHIRNAHAGREIRLRGWDADGHPALSVSIISRLIYSQTLQEFIGAATIADARERATGIWATDGATRGEVVGVVGQVGAERERLMTEAPHILPDFVTAAGDDEWVIVLKAGQIEVEYLARSLRPIVRLPHLGRFDVDRAQVINALQMSPRRRAGLVRTVSDIAKGAGIIGKAYDSRIAPDAFFSADFEMNLRFSDNRVRRYAADKLIDDFLQCGVYRLREDFDAAPVRVCVVNTLPLKIEDFVEALRRQLDRHFPFEIEVIRERRVRVVSRSNLESAVRAVQKEEPDIILAFFADEDVSGDDEDSNDDATAAYIKSLTLGRGLPTHVIYESVLNDPDAMTGIILSILGKTGSTPYVLTEPIETADYVVGLDVVRQTFVTIEDTRLTAIARVYRADGEFLHYRVREAETIGGQLPYALLRDLFPPRMYGGRRILIHHDGDFPPDLADALGQWGRAINAQFLPVAINRQGAPRLYAIESGKITAPAWGSAFKLNDAEALLVSFVPDQPVTPQPLHITTIRAGAPPAPIDEALRSVLVWTLLTYGAARPPKMPVTVVNADHLGGWLRKGNRFSLDDGIVPFWL